MGKPVTKTETPPTPSAKDQPKTNVVAISPRTMEAVPAHLRADVDEFAGAGTSSRREDTLVPFMYIAQKGHPQVNKRDAAYIEGLEPGMVFNTATRQIWDAENGAGPLMLQFYFEPCEVEWGMRDTPDKGYKGKHPADTNLLTQVREVPKPTGKGVFRMLPNGHQLTTTKYHYMILVEELQPVALPLSSSGLQASRGVNFALRNKKVRGAGGRLVVAPSFSTLLRLRTVWVKDGEYDYFVPILEDLGWVTPEAMDAYEEAKLMFQSAREGGLRVAEPTVETEPVTGYAAQEGDPDADPTDDSPL